MFLLLLLFLYFIHYLPVNNLPTLPRLEQSPSHLWHLPLGPPALHTAPETSPISPYRLLERPHPVASAPSQLPLPLQVPAESWSGRVPTPAPSKINISAAGNC